MWLIHNFRLVTDNSCVINSLTLVRHHAVREKWGLVGGGRGQLCLRECIIISTSGHIFLQPNSANTKNCSNDAFYAHFAGNCCGFHVYPPPPPKNEHEQCCTGFKTSFINIWAPSVGTPGFWSIGFWICKKNTGTVQNSLIPRNTSK